MRIPRIQIDPDCADWSERALVAEGRLERAQDALDHCGIGGIEAEFEDIPDAISQMAFYIKGREKRVGVLGRRLEEAREELVRIRDRLIDRDPPYAVAIDRVLAVLRNEQYLADSAPDEAATGKELQEDTDGE